MAARIEDYALIGDTGTAALVSRQGSIDWFCAPRFDSGACLAALLGSRRHGQWAMAPVGVCDGIERRYRGDTLVLETVFTTPTGAVAVIDFMPVRVAGSGSSGVRGSAGGRETAPTIVRIVEGRAGTSTMRTELALRFDYGSIVPWVQALEAEGGAPFGFRAVGGADGLVVHADVELTPSELHHSAVFTVAAGERRTFTLSWFASHLPSPAAIDAVAVLAETERWWQDWADHCTYEGPWRAEVRRSLLTLKGLTYAPTGGIVAAATTSLPEWIGSVRNWDYRYCWLRDATFTLTALIDAGHTEEAMAWSDWLRRAIAGSPEKMQIMYGVAGERRLDEYEVDWLPGYEASAPVRVGNAASGQFQLDVYGEVMDMFWTTAARDLPQTSAVSGRHDGLPPDAIDLARMLADHVRTVWRQPDDGIWEVRGPRQHFVHSKVMAWVAIDRWVRLVEHLELEDDPAPWRALADEIHADVCGFGYDGGLGAFTQYYGSGSLDASVLMMGLVGFLPPTDPRLVTTIDAIARTLLVDGFVRRYETSRTVAAGPVGLYESEDGAGLAGGADDAGDAGDFGDAPATVDGLPPGEGSFLLTTFWLVDCYVLLGRLDEATALFERLVALRNDVGLLAEEFDPAGGRLLGNFPQAFSHVGLVNSAFNLHSALEHDNARVTNRSVARR